MAAMLQTEAPKATQPDIAGDELALLESIQRRVLWLSTAMVQHANNVRANPEKTKVGGHQSSSASIVSILTALYFKYLQAGDRVAVKPHGSPAYHAVQYLLGNLPGEYLTRLRAYGGLQAYPSRTKDVFPVDFSTGSMGLGAVAPAFAAMAARYAELHFGSVTSRRFVAILGDAELDEGNVWEAATEDHIQGLGNLLWIVDLNRQSLDRVVPGIRAARLKALFRDSGWHVLEAKYGRRLQAVFRQPGGDALRQRIDDMSNEEYQTLIRLAGPALRPRLIGNGPDAVDVEASVSQVADDDLPSLLADLAGHDLAELLAAFDAAFAVADKPSVLFAYTIKGWGLPFAGHPLNHSALATEQQFNELRQQLGIQQGREWDGFPPESPEGRLCLAAAERLREAAPSIAGLDVQVPASVDLRPFPLTSSQEAFGRLLTELARQDGLGERIVTAAPDVSVSTNLGGWINKVGVYWPTETLSYDDETDRLLRWEPGPSGQHIELGISEMNLFMLLGQLGLGAELLGQQLFPIGTLYDPFVCRGLDALIHGLYSSAKMIVVGTPSGISLSPEGGAHQSQVTPSLGVELPNIVSYEPCFSREVEWTLLEALRACADRANGLSTYLRLSTKPIDQSLLEPALEHFGEQELRRQVLAGGYRLIDYRVAAGDLDDRYVVQLAVAGAMVPEAVAAARLLHEEGVAANVLCLTSADLLYRGLREARRRHLERGTSAADVGHLGELILSDERRAPIVTVHDAASHTLSFLGSAFGAPLVPLGVDHFGQSGSRAELYAHEGIDPDSIVNAALLALDLAE
jgi:pyruvate dehydrogenase E1 component